MSIRILIVDDEEIVVRSCMRILGDLGCEVASSNNGAEALRLANQERERFSEVLPDLVKSIEKCISEEGRFL